MITIQSSKSPRYLPMRNEAYVHQKIGRKIMCALNIHHKLKLETTQMFISRRVGEKNWYGHITK